jgi:hypothetical protein
MADAPDAPAVLTDYEYSPAYGRDAPLSDLLPGNHTAPPAPLLAADEPSSESPGAFFWTVGLNLALLLLATYTMFVLREKPRTWARRIFFPRMVQVRNACSNAVLDTCPVPHAVHARVRICLAWLGARGSPGCVIHGEAFDRWYEKRGFGLGFQGFQHRLAIQALGSLAARRQAAY